MKLTPKIQKALDQATLLHRDYARKGSDIPYIIHPVAVAKRYINRKN